MAGDPPRPGPKPRSDPHWPSPPKVRILMVCDEQFSYTAEHKFGLTELIAALEWPSLFVSFAITKAHRESSVYAGDADIAGWFFGLRRDAETIAPLTAAELRIVSEFMDGGGGVFATGDHEDIGAAMCRQIPRVRSMRKWHFDYDAVADGYENYDPASGDGPPCTGRGVTTR